ncbi:MAG: hypothetical protein F4Y75_09235 [Acidimicrobiia bacterium]|nr:hypothetical protein [Acidimicrobiia bacterium]MYF26172.1 hypothetical protein [Acidimicrobiia bacterium]
MEPPSANDATIAIRTVIMAYIEVKKTLTIFHIFPDSRIEREEWKNCSVRSRSDAVSLGLMQRPSIRILDVGGTPGEMGYLHGRTYAEEIRAYTEERVGLASSGLWTGAPLSRDKVLALAEDCLPAHYRQSPELYEEMAALAEAAGITRAEAVVVGGFTDFVDTVRSHLGDLASPPLRVEDDCTGFIVPDHRAGGAGFFGQTWDMHASATDYVIMLRAQPDQVPAALIFTTMGCLGQIGMNELGVCVGMTNLSAADGRIGVTWPTVVRHALQTETATEARDVIMGADLAGGHNYLVFDAKGIGFNIEAMPTVREETGLSTETLVHTNHTTVESTQAVETDRPSELQRSSHRRLKAATEHLDGPQITAEDLMTLTRQEVCQTASPPYRIETSGAAIMRPKTKDFWAVWGSPRLNDYTRIKFP